MAPPLVLPTLRWFTTTAAWWSTAACQATTTVVAATPQCARTQDNGRRPVSPVQVSDRFHRVPSGSFRFQQGPAGFSRIVQSFQRSLTMFHCVIVGQRRRPLSASWRCSVAGVCSGEQTGSRRSLGSTRFLSHSCPAPSPARPSSSDGCCPAGGVQRLQGLPGLLP